MSRVAVIGAGLIGRSWAIVFARAGWDVALFDADASVARQALALVTEGLADLSKHGLLDDAETAASRVRVVANLADALAGAILVQENLPETVAAKRAIFADLDRLAAPDAILASSTSSVVASRFTEHLANRQRCLVAHPVNPPHLVPLVELVGSPWTAHETISGAQQIYITVGQVPIVVRREIEGFILNRLQGALLAEALRLVGQGFVSPQDLDRTVKDGLGLRWSFMGPFETIDLNAPGGIVDYFARYGDFYGRVQADAARPEVYAPESVQRATAEWRHASTEQRQERARWRDRRLAALIAHKRSQVAQQQDN